MGIGKSATLELKEKSKAEAEKAKKVQFIEPEAPKKPVKPAPGSSGRQIVPGLLIVSSASEGFTTPTKTVTTTANTLAPETAEPTTDKASSPSSTTSNQDSGIGESGVSPRDQLSYLGQLIGFTVSYSDFPKGNHSEFLSLVTLSTEPAHMSHGSGSNVSESRADAAMKALGYISDIGLDNIKPKAK